MLVFFSLDIIQYIKELLIYIELVYSFNLLQTGPVSWAEFYFKCAEHTSEGEKDQAVPLCLIRPNISDVPCLACTDVW